MNVIEMTKRYFECFSNQDIDALSEMFLDDIELKDWENELSGKSEVIELIKGIYGTLGSVKIIPALITSEGNTAMAEILISAGPLALEVVDVIEYDNDKIKAIRAYKI